MLTPNRVVSAQVKPASRTICTRRTPGIAATLPFGGPGGETYFVTYNVMLTRLSDFTAGLSTTSD